MEHFPKTLYGVLLQLHIKLRVGGMWTGREKAFGTSLCISKEMLLMGQPEILLAIGNYIIRTQFLLVDKVFPTPYKVDS